MQHMVNDEKTTLQPHKLPIKVTRVALSAEIRPHFGGQFGLYVVV